MTREKREIAVKEFKEWRDSYYNKNKLPATMFIEEAIKVLEQEPCEDCVSRQAVKELYYKDGYIDFRKICDLPPVTPQPKIGRWIESKGYDDRDHFYTCSECGRCINLICGAKLTDYPYCHCGAKMEVENDY